MKKKIDDFGQFPKYICYKCGKILENEFFLHCIDIINYDMCMYCFQERKNSNNLRFVMFPDAFDKNTIANWKIQEEILLLYGLVHLGFDNWYKIESLFKNHSYLECRNHYYETYLGLERCEWYPLDILPQSVQSIPSDSFGSGFGFMPFRDEYEIENNNNAEIDIVGMNIDSNDDINSFNGKLDLLKTYSKEVSIRRKMHKFIRKNGLHTKSVKNFIEIIDSLKDNALTSYISVFNEEKRLQEHVKYVELLIHFGIVSKQEAKLIHSLQKNISDDKISNLSNYYQSDSYVSPVNEKILSKTEKEFITSNNIPLSHYLYLRKAQYTHSLIFPKSFHPAITEFFKENSSLLTQFGLLLNDY